MFDIDSCINSGRCLFGFWLCGWCGRVVPSRQLKWSSAWTTPTIALGLTVRIALKIALQNIAALSSNVLAMLVTCQLV